VRALQPSDLLSLYSAASLDDFIDETFRLLPRIVTCDYVSTFSRRCGRGFLNERDSRGRVWNRAFMRRYIELSPAIPLVFANPGIKVLPTRLGLSASEAELRSTPFYREIMRVQGWRHGVALCFWAQPPAPLPIFVLAVYRREGQPDFAAGETAALESLHPFLAPAVSRFHEISVSEAISEGVATALRHISPGIVVLDWQLRVVRTNLAGRRALTEWQRTSARRHAELARGFPSVPGCVLQACHELRRELASIERRDPGAKTHRQRYVSHPEAPELLASVTVISLGRALSEPSFVVEFERPSGGAQPEGPAPPLALTKSEARVAIAVAEGCSNEEAAERLGKTVHAVKFLLHRIYQKLGIPNRTRLSVLLRRSDSVAGT
jgi:DNA-binding NarL/FixJ family response regulator